MSLRRIRFQVDSGRVNTTSTSQIALGGSGFSSLPAGNESILGSGPWCFSIKSMIYSHDTGGAHGARIYYKVVGGRYSTSTGLDIGTGENDTAASNGIIYGGPFSATITYAISGNAWQCLVTPPAATSYYWVGIHNVEIVSMAVL